MTGIFSSNGLRSTATASPTVKKEVDVAKPKTTSSVILPPRHKENDFSAMDYDDQYPNIEGIIASIIFTS